MGRPSQVEVDSRELLERHGLSDVPEVFAMRNEDGSVIQEREPCYQCHADVFLGKGTYGTHYMEGSIVVTNETPNEHMQPLNKAAAVAYATWMQSLPHNRAPIDVGDMAEAAQMLAKDPDVTNLAPLAYQEAVIKLAEELKIRRDGGTSKRLPGLSHNFSPVSGGKAPPILGAKMSDMSQRGPGTTAGTVIPSGQGARRAAVLGGAPPR